MSLMTRYNKRFTASLCLIPTFLWKSRYDLLFVDFSLHEYSSNIVQMALNAYQTANVL